MESDPRAYDDFLMRDLSVIRDLVQKSSSQCIVFKALHEAHDLCNLMDLFHPAKVIWVFRHYTDTINSNLARWPGGRNQLDDIMQNNSTGVWRALGMTEHTRSQVSALYRADINDETAQALFWYYRNQLFFDQNLQDDHRAYIISYEPTVTRPDLYITHLSKWLGIEPNSHMIAHLHTGSVRKKRPPEIEPDVAALCDDMMERLNDVWTRQMNAVGALPDGAQ